MKVIQCEIGKFGGFGNQLFQFLFSKFYADKYNAELQISKDWIGRKIFQDVDEIKPITICLPETPIDVVPWGQTNIKLKGYFQYKEAIDLFSISKIRNLLKFKKDIIKKYSSPYKKEYAAVHIRRGDYVDKYSHIFCNISNDSYKKALEKFNTELYPVRFCMSNLVKRDDSNADSFLYDFFIMMQSTILFRSNSTFSFWAGVLGNQDRIYSPIVENLTGWNTIEFVEGNHPKLIGDYKGASPQKPCELILKE